MEVSLVEHFNSTVHRTPKVRYLITVFNDQNKNIQIIISNADAR